MGKSIFSKLKDGLAKTRDSFISKINDAISDNSQVNDDLYDELEEILISSDIGVKTSEDIIERVKKAANDRGIKDSSEIKECLKEVILDILGREKNTILPDRTPCVMLVIGVNGVGKTTSIGKIASKLKSKNYKVILAAADTFRAAAIDQLEIWSERAGVDIVKHQEGSDPAAVVYDAVQAAKARKAEILICDTAGRLHNKKNLMDELSKIDRVINKEYSESYKETYLVLDASTGQNAVEQAKQFSAICHVDGIILTKLDGTSKGGIIISIKEELNIPVKLIGVGEGIDDLQTFDSEDFVNALFS